MLAGAAALAVDTESLVSVMRAFLHRLCRFGPLLSVPLLSAVFRALVCFFSLLSTTVNITYLALSDYSTMLLALFAPCATLTHPSTPHILRFLTIPLCFWHFFCYLNSIDTPFDITYLALSDYSTTLQAYFIYQRLLLTSWYCAYLALVYSDATMIYTLTIRSNPVITAFNITSFIFWNRPLCLSTCSIIADRFPQNSLQHHLYCASGFR